VAPHVQPQCVFILLLLIIAMCAAGRCYERGTGVKLNLNEARKYFLLAADQGHTNAAKELTKYLIPELVPILCHRSPT
jgi:TPR repeat protein